MNSELSTKTTFGWLNATQFFGALNDNLFKLFIIFFLSSLYGTESTLRVSAIASALFVIPFLLFATTAGNMADRFSKKRIIVWTKVLEVVVMTLGCVAFLKGIPALLYAALVLMATQSAVFGPSKYGIIPELVGRGNLSRANSFLTAFTYLAIVLGMGLGPFIPEWTAENYFVATLICVLVAVAGLLSSFFIRTTSPVRSGKPLSPFIVTDVWRTLRSVRSDGYLLLAVLASAYFLLIGAFIQINLLPYGIEVLGLSTTGSGRLFLLVAIGIGLGALLAGKLSGENVEFGIVPLGAIGMTLASFGLAATPPSLVLVLFLVFVMGVSVGLFIVPLNAFIQFRSPRKRIGEILAASSFLSWVGVLLASVFLYLAGTFLGLSARQGFVVVTVLTLVLGVFSLVTLPDFLVRFMGVIVTRFCYRVRSLGLENYPVEGPALLVANHVSFVDALIIGAVRARRVRFVMNRQMYNHRWMNPVYRLMGVIPISFQDSRRDIMDSLQAARRALDDGYVVCIFAEGAITRTGLPREFKGGFELIVRDTDYPIVPVYLGGMWGSILSYAHGDIFSRWPVQFPYPVTVVFGEARPSTSPAAEIRQAVVELSCDYFESLKPTRAPLGEVFLRTARKNRGRLAMTDSTGKRLKYGEVLNASLTLAAVLRRHLAREERVGLLLPSTAGGAIANLAVTLLGKVGVNLNYTASSDGVGSAVEQCGIHTIITSRPFLEKLGGLEVPGNRLYLEDLMAAITTQDKVKALVKGWLVPSRLLARARGFDADKLLTVIFSSGSTGDPKGVMLSHHNVMSNIEALRMVFRVTSHDNLCAVLPFFHSFGYTGTIWFPLLSGFSVSYHANPLDGAGVAKVVRENRSSLLLSTPTFLLSYLRRADREDFKSLRMVIAGAEKLKQRVADAFYEKIGVRPYEGYGATELSPVGALNIPDVVIDRVAQVGGKAGSIGHPLPGVAMKIVDPDTGKDLPLETPGLLLVKGPNVMLGYLNRPDLTEDVLRDGWYHTGDIAAMDAEGFVIITDRLSRFSKIGGEMVPHIAVEEAYYQALGKSDQVLAVTSVPDEKKGERLVVLYTAEAGTPEALYEAMAGTDLPNLWKPARNAYYLVAELPVLGSGKVDVRGLKTLAESAAEGPSGSS